MNIPKVEYDIYSKLSGNKLIKLCLKVCENSKVSLSIIIILPESLDKLSSSNDFYNDVFYSPRSAQIVMYIYH